MLGGFDIFKKTGLRKPADSSGGGPVDISQNASRKIEVKNLDDHSLGSPEYTMYTMNDPEVVGENSIDEAADLNIKDEELREGKALGYEVKKKEFTKEKNSFMEDFEVAVSADEKAAEIIKELNKVFFEIRDGGQIFADSSSKDDLRKALKEAVIRNLGGHNFSQDITSIIEKMDQVSKTSPFNIEAEEDKSADEVAAKVIVAEPAPKVENIIEPVSVSEAQISEEAELTEERQENDVEQVVSGKVISGNISASEYKENSSEAERREILLEFIDDGEKLHAIYAKEVASLLENSKFKKNKETRSAAEVFSKKSDEILSAWRELLDLFSVSKEKTAEIVLEFEALDKKRIALLEEIGIWDESKIFGRKTSEARRGKLLEIGLERVEKITNYRLEQINAGKKNVKLKLTAADITDVKLEKLKQEERKELDEKIAGAGEKIKRAKKEFTMRQRQAEKKEQKVEHKFDPWAEELKKALEKIETLTAEEFNDRYEPSQIAEAFGGDYAKDLAEFLHAHEHDSVDQFTSDEKKAFENAVKAANVINDENNPLKIVIVNGNTYKVRKKAKLDLPDQDFSHMTETQEGFLTGEKMEQDEKTSSESETEEAEERNEKKEFLNISEKVVGAFRNYAEILLNSTREQLIGEDGSSSFLDKFEKDEKKQQFLILLSEPSLREKIREKEAFMVENFEYSREKEDALVDYIFDLIVKK